MKNILLPLQILAFSIFSIYGLFLWQGHQGFNLADEGFLWYGAQRVLLGEVPIRDFMTYDPGRYYYSAAVMSLLGNNGIMALRTAVAIFQSLGLFVGLLLIARTVKKQNFFYLLLSALTLVVWMFPLHKLFDISLSIFLIGILAFLIENPTSRRYFITGMCVGLVAFFGRNHGIYAVAGSLGVMLWLSIKQSENIGLIKGFSLWSTGVLIGYLPMILMMLLVPGFAEAFLKSISYLLERGSTNIPLPIPWPWLVNFNLVPLDLAIRALMVGLFFIAIIVFGVLSIAWVIWQRIHKKQVSSALAAASFLVLPYAHYAYSRADMGHLAQGIFPLLVGCLVLLSTQPTRIKWPLVLLLSAASVWVMHIAHPGWQCHTSKQCVDIEISGSNLLVDPSTANDVRLLRQLADQYAPKDQSFIAAPFWPGAYALLERKSPMWEICALRPRSKAFELAEIEGIKAQKPGFVFILDHPLDGHDELRFRNTHPLIHQYFLDNFELLPGSTNPEYQIYKAKRGQ